MNCFKREPKPMPVEEHGHHDYFVPIWGAIIPHLRDNPGAKSFDGKYTENVYGSICIPKIGIPWESRDNGGVFGATHRLVKIYKINASIEIHYNAFNQKAHGYEILVLKGDSLSAKFARFFIEAFEDKYPKRRKRREDGIFFVKRGEAGYENLVASKRAGVKVAILPELFFGDNSDDFMTPKDQSDFWKENLLQRMEHGVIGKGKK